jgi:glutamate--cysteine ligase
MNGKNDMGQTGTELQRRIADAGPAIERWFEDQWKKLAAPFYASVDIRNSGVKIAPVDINLFPAGFNNLNSESPPQCLEAIVSRVENLCPGTRRVLLVPENHTRNTGYLENVIALQAFLRRAGLELRVGSCDPGLTAATEIRSASGTLRLEPVRRSGNRVGVEGFDPCLVLLNNDLSDGVPDLLRDLDQLVLPPLYAGWTTRRKSNHFAIYQDLATQVAGVIGIDPWLINAYFMKCGSINFNEQTGIECIEFHVSQILARIRAKYREHGITEDPFVIVKADAGTYGMAVMTVKDPSEVHILNRRQRKKMEMAKGHAEVHEVMVQEGVHTSDLVDGSSAEPVIYMVDKFVIGGFYRVTAGRGNDENLNVPGSHFVTFAADQSAGAAAEPGPGPGRDGVNAYGVIARTALIATALELEQAAANLEQHADAVLQSRSP